MATRFNVNFNVSADELQGKTVLVFLKPQQPQRNYQIHAWQVLTGSAGATESFDYEAQISTDVSSPDVNDARSSRAARTSCRASCCRS